MNTFKHKVFLKDNTIAMESLDPMLRKRILGFDELLDDLQHAVDEDSLALEEKILKLDREIEEDLYEEYEDRLENNDELEEEKQDDKIANSKSEDKKILEELYKKKQTENLSKAMLLKLGFKGDLSKKSLRFGAYHLQRTSLFTFHFRIVKDHTNQPLWKR